MSTEKYARRTLRRIVFWRFVGAVFILPQAVLRGLVSFLTMLGGWCKDMELSIFYLELDSAYRYKLLTGIDLGTASGDPGRYSHLDPERAEAVQKFLFSLDTGPEE